MDHNSSTEKIQIRKFDLNKIASDAIIMIIGKRRSGKSHLSRDIIHTLSLRNMPYGKVYSGTEHCSPFFKKFFPQMFIEQTFTDQDIANILQMQHRKVKKVAKRLHVDDGKCAENNMLLVLDDMMSEDDIWKKSKHFKKLFTEGRHYNILFLMTLQYVLGIPPTLRDNIDYVFLFNCEGNALKKMYENYGSSIPTLKMFKTILAQCTKEYSCLVIDKTCTSNRLEDKIFFYKAKDPGKFKFGSNAFWNLHDENYYSSEDEEMARESAAQQKLKNICEMYGEDGKNGKKYVISIG